MYCTHKLIRLGDTKVQCKKCREIWFCEYCSARVKFQNEREAELDKLKKDVLDCADCGNKSQWLICADCEFFYCGC
jgi:hypothetical protein